MKKNTEKRRLQWLFNYGTVTLAARFTNSKAPVSLVITPLQASILMVFNTYPKLTFDELLLQLWPTQSLNAKQMLTGSSSTANLHDMSLEEILRFAVQPLVYFKYKVLAKEKDDEPKKELIKKTDVFLLREKKFPPKNFQEKLHFLLDLLNNKKKKLMMIMN